MSTPIYILVQLPNVSWRRHDTHEAFSIIRLTKNLKSSVLGEFLREYESETDEPIVSLALDRKHASFSEDLIKCLVLCIALRCKFSDLLRIRMMSAMQAAVDISFGAWQLATNTFVRAYSAYTSGFDQPDCILPLCVKRILETSPNQLVDTGVITPWKALCPLQNGLVRDARAYLNMSKTFGRTIQPVLHTLLMSEVWRRHCHIGFMPGPQSDEQRDANKALTLTADVHSQQQLLVRFCKLNAPTLLYCAKLCENQSAARIPLDADDESAAEALLALQTVPEALPPPDIDFAQLDPITT